jgi:hypothetical protein
VHTPQVNNPTVRNIREHKLREDIYIQASEVFAAPGRRLSRSTPNWQRQRRDAGRVVIKRFNARGYIVVSETSLERYKRQRSRKL